ncbi:uncharacterized protein PG986_001469 [Apiospora aurea]|uniref:Uncharacterized protein n=1 Tax=Apiospora aurea TaxID=335848 RepID=A0ABR1QWW6_9PEZI
MTNVPQNLPSLGVQYIPNTGGCVVDIAAAVNLAQCSNINIKVQEQYHVEVFPDTIHIAPSLPSPEPPPRVRPHQTGPLPSPGPPPRVRLHPTSSVPSPGPPPRNRPYPTGHLPCPPPPPPPPYSRPNEQRPSGGVPQEPIRRPTSHNPDHAYQTDPWYPGPGSRPPPAKKIISNNQPVAVASGRLHPQQPPSPLPPFCNQSTVVVDDTKISTISRHDIENRLHALGLVNLNADLDVGAILKSVMGSKRRSAGLGGITGTFTGVLGRITGGNSVVNKKGNVDGNTGNGNGATGNKIPPGKKTDDNQAPAPKLPPGVDPDAIRRALIRHYTVQCGFSYRTHGDVQATTAASYTECLHTCATHASSSSTTGARDCLGASFDRHVGAGAGKCWYVVGAAHTTLDSRYKIADGNCDSFSLVGH